MHAAGCLLLAASIVLSTDLAPADRQRITRVKHEVRDAVVDALAAEADPDRALLRARWMTRSLDGVKVASQRPQGHPGLLAVTTDLAIPCGDDASLYLFRKEASGWKLIFAREENGYAKVSGALGSFEYRLSPPDANGDFFIALASINPWCTSAWQTLRYEIRRVGETPYNSRLLFADTQSYYMGADYELAAGADEVEIRWQAEQSLDLARHTRDYVRHYRVRGDAVERVGPIATGAEELIDEWAHMPWEEASQYGGTKSVHELLRRRGFYSQFVETAKQDDGTWRVVLSIEKKPKNRRVTFVVDGDRIVDAREAR